MPTTKTITLTGDAPWYGRIAETVLTKSGLAGLILVLLCFGVGMAGLKILPAACDYLRTQAKAATVQTEILRDVKTALQESVKCQQQQTLLFDSIRRDQAQALTDHREMMASLREHRN